MVSCLLAPPPLCLRYQNKSLVYNRFNLTISREYDECGVDGDDDVGAGGGEDPSIKARVAIKSFNLFLF